MMDQLNSDLCSSSTSLQNQSQPRQRSELEAKDPVAARKVQKADREKLRRDRLNEHFLELGNTLDPDKPKNDKATILTETIQVLKELTTEVNKLKAEYAAFSEESCELMQEKNELREEKASLKSEIESLNAQYQQRLRVVYPWGAVDTSMMMGPAYSYAVPIPVPPGTIPMHPTIQPFPFFGNPNSNTLPSPCSTYIAYPATANPAVEQVVPYASSSHASSRPVSRCKSSDLIQGSDADNVDDSNDVATELELKMPGSSMLQLSTPGEGKGKKVQRKERNPPDGSSSSRFSSHAIQDSPSNSVSDIPKSTK